MGPVAALIAIIGISLLIIRIGAVALMKTGLSRQSSQFQSMSAFFGVGFTTREAEYVVNHPVRRKIITHLVYLGNLGVISGLGSIVLTFQSADDGRHVSKIGLLLGSVLLFWVVTRFKPIMRLIDRTIGSAMAESGHVVAVDYDHMLRIKHGYYISDVKIDPASELVGQTVEAAEPERFNVVLLGIARADGGYVGVPTADTEIRTGDQLVVYGRDPDVHAFAEPHREREPEEWAE